MPPGSVYNCQNMKIRFINSEKEKKKSYGRLWKKLATFALFIDLQLLSMCYQVIGIAIEIALAQRRRFCT